MSQDKRKRDYKKEYARDHATPKAKAARGARNKSRKAFAKAGLVPKPGKPGKHKTEVDHKDGNPMNNKRSNLKVLPKRGPKGNRAKQ